MAKKIRYKKKPKSIEELISSRDQLYSQIKEYEYKKGFFEYKKYAKERSEYRNLIRDMDWSLNELEIKVKPHNYGLDFVKSYIELKTEACIDCEAVVIETTIEKRDISDSEEDSTESKVITTSFKDEKPPHYIKALSPECKDFTYSERHELHSCYYLCLKRAREYGCKSISFPLLSVKKGLPTACAWIIALDSCERWLRDNNEYGITITFVLEDEQTLLEGKNISKCFDHSVFIEYIID